MVRTKHYHHGSLREVLLKAATRLLAQAGPLGFALREVARRARVSHNAPCRHFAGREASLATVATQSLRELARWMRKETSARPSAREQLKHSGLAYISFALRRPERFAAMLHAPISKSTQGELGEASREAFAILADSVTRAGARHRNARDHGRVDDRAASRAPIEPLTAIQGPID